MRIFILFGLFILFVCSNCEKAILNTKYPLEVENNSNHPIKVYFNDNEKHRAVYPDTFITDFKKRTQEILAGETKIVAESSNWESVYEVSVPNGKLSIFFFHPDTLSNYPWDTIRSRYLILKREDLSLEDLQKRNFVITYQ